MALTVTPTTELDAINTMLAVIGESPLNSLLNLQSVSAVSAKATLSETSRAVQSEGWHFNTETDFELSPDISTGEIKPPANTLRVDTCYPDEGTDVVHRGTRLYDRKKHTYSFEKSLKVEMVVCLPFDELPETARHYITIRGARVFQARELGSDTLFRFTAQDEQDARIALKRAEAITGDYNMLSDSYTVARTLRRS